MEDGETDKGGMGRVWGGGDGKRWRREERRGEGRGDTMWGKNKTGSEMMMTKEKKKVMTTTVRCI